MAEPCRLRANECVTLLAQWHVDDPDSRELAALEKKIREHPDFSRQIPLGMVERLTHLFGKPEKAEADGDGIGRVQSDTNRFVVYYHHAAPFPRGVLRDEYRACESDPERAKDCAESRQEAERILGPLDGDRG